MRRANCGGGRHCGDTGGNRDETACACGSRAGRSDVNDHGNRRTQKTLYDLLRRIEQTARRVKLNYQTLGVLRSGFVYAARNVARCRRPDRSVDIDISNLLGCDACSRSRKTNQETRKPGKDQNSGKPLLDCWTPDSFHNCSVALRRLKLLSSVGAWSPSLLLSASRSCRNR